ncbi:hypothetical protein DXA14_33275 [Hungatella hathewayi]|nr:hypothetical protein DXA14_33275 [Hungatella hathewayi]
MITAEFKDFEEMMGFARNLVSTVETQDKPPVQQTAPVAPPPVQQAPVQTTAPSYTPDDLARAAMTLMDSGRQGDLIDLLAQFGADTLTHLQPEQYGAFATALRGLGAPI